jgi:protein-disulfide isomerase
MTATRSLVLAAVAAPLALALAACGSGDDAGPGAAPTGQPIAPVAAPQGQTWSQVVSATPGGGMLMGNPEAPLKVIEYGSLSCPHCAKLANDGMQTLVDKYVNSGRVSYEFRSFPIHGIIDVPLTVMVRCAAPSAFFPLVEQIYANQNDIMTRAEQGNAQAQAAADLPPAQRFPALADAFGLTDWFAARGLSKDQAHACLADTSAAETIAKEGQAWSEDGINQTPTLVLNGQVLENVSTWGPNGSYPGLETTLQNAGAR